MNIDKITIDSPVGYAVRTYSTREAPMHANAKLRQALLETLYQHRAARAGTLQPQWVSEYELKARHGDVAFALDILEEVGHVQRDGPHYWITGPGVLACEAHL